MTADEELISQRRRFDERTFIRNTLDQDKAPRLSLAAIPMRSLLSDGAWHAHAQMIATGLRDSDLAVKTVDNLLRRLVKAGLVERRGAYVAGSPGYIPERSRRPAQDDREYRLIEWTLNDK